MREFIITIKQVWKIVRRNELVQEERDAAVFGYVMVLGSMCTKDDHPIFWAFGLLAVQLGVAVMVYIRLRKQTSIR